MSDHFDTLEADAPPTTSLPERGQDMFARGQHIDPRNHISARSKLPVILGGTTTAYDTGGPHAPMPPKRPSISDLSVGR